MPIGAWAALLEAVVRGRMRGQDVLNVLHFGTDIVVNDGIGRERAEQLANDIMDVYTTLYLPAASVQFELRDILVHDIYPQKGDPFQFSFPAGSVGQQAGETLPTYSTQRLILRTGGGGRNGRGRIQLSPPAESAAANDQVTDAQFGLLMGIAEGLFDNFGLVPAPGAPHDFTLGILNRFKNKVAVPPEPENFREVREVLADRVLGTQNRRKVGRGS